MDFIRRFERRRPSASQIPTTYVSSKLRWKHLLVIALCLNAVPVVSKSVSRKQTTSMVPSASSGEAPLLAYPLVPHHEVVARRQRQRRDLQSSPRETSAQPDEFQIDPLYQGIGTHYVDLWVGCPPQRQTLIVDTGSGATAFPCQGCQNCGEYFEHNETNIPDEEDDEHFHTDPLYHPAESTCFRLVQCPTCEMGGQCYSEKEYQDHIDQTPPAVDAGPNIRDDASVCHISMGYAEGSSWYATESVDRAYAGGFHESVDWQESKMASFDLVFGCQTKVTGLFRSQLADGITGMMKEKSAYWRQVYDAQLIQKRAFSLCYTRNPYLTREGTGAGAMILGGTDQRLHTTDMVFAEDVMPHWSMFTVFIEGMYLRANGGDSKVVPSSRAHNVVWKTISETHEDFGAQTIVDSGTTSTYFGGALQDTFMEAFKELSGGLEYSRSVDYKLSAEELAALPTIILRMKAWKDDDGNIPVQDETEVDGKKHRESILVAMPPSHYMKYYPDQNIYRAKVGFRSGFAPLTLGANFMMGHDLFFDVENSRIGFAESQCDYHAMGYKKFNHTSSAAETDAPSSTHDPEPGSTTTRQDHSTKVFFVMAFVGFLAVALFVRRTTVPGRDYRSYEAARLYADSLDADFQDKGYRDDDDDDDYFDEDDEEGNGTNGYSDDKETEMVETSRNGG